MDLFLVFSKLDIHIIADKQLLYHEKVKSQTKFRSGVLPSVILFTGEIAFQYYPLCKSKPILTNTLNRCLTNV